MRKITILSTAVILTITSIIYLQQKDSELIASFDVSNIQSETSIVENLKPQSTSRKKRLFEEKEVNTQEQKVINIQVVLEEQNDWALKQGFTTVHDVIDPNHMKTISSIPSDYETYDNETLKVLAANDSKAALVLGIRMLESNQLDQAEEYLYEANIHGYARALVDINKLHLMRAKQFDKNNSQDKADKAYIQAFAWAQLGNLRFYPGSTTIENSAVVSIKQERYDRIKKQALIEASKIYEKLKKQREEKGLSEFDNYIPKSFSNE